MADHCASSSWSELPYDLLDRILQRLELHESLAVAAVCASWRSAAAASGVPPSGTPWLVSLVTESESTGSEFRNLLNIHKTHMVSFHPGRRCLLWCGASHGWLIATDHLANLLLYNPFTFAMIPLPPITELECVKGVYDDDGSIVGYHYGISDMVLSPDGLGCWFYTKVVLSCDPSRAGGDDCTAMAICGNSQVSFARPGESGWRPSSTTPCLMREEDMSCYEKTKMAEEGMCADCVYHNGRFYTVTMGGEVEMWDLSEHVPDKDVIVAGDRRYIMILTRFLVSTPWGALLQIRTLRRNNYRWRINVEVLEVDVEGRRLVRLSPGTAFREHAVFVGLNESACLRAKEFPELRPNCVYFTTPWLMNLEKFGLQGWSGVVIYDLESQTFEDVIDTSERFKFVPREVWFIPNM